MNITAKGDIVFGLSEFLEKMDDETRRDLVKTLACQDSVIKDVADQIIDNMTEDGSYGAIACIASEEPRFGLDYAKRLWAKRSSDFAKGEIERLEKALKHSEEDNRRLRDELHSRGR